jgi:hypothetical protein
MLFLPKCNSLNEHDMIFDTFRESSGRGAIVGGGSRAGNNRGPATGREIHEDDEDEDDYDDDDEDDDDNGNDVQPSGITVAFVCTSLVTLCAVLFLCTVLFLSLTMAPKAKAKSVPPPPSSASSASSSLLLRLLLLLLLLCLLCLPSSSSSSSSSSSIENQPLVKL